MKSGSVRIIQFPSCPFLNVGSIFACPVNHTPRLPEASSLTPFKRVRMASVEVNRQQSRNRRRIEADSIARARQLRIMYAKEYFSTNLTDCGDDGEIGDEMN